MSVPNNSRNSNICVPLEPGEIFHISGHSLSVAFRRQDNEAMCNIPFQLDESHDKNSCEDIDQSDSSASTITGGVERIGDRPVEELRHFPAETLGDLPPATRTENVHHLELTANLLTAGEADFSIEDLIPVDVNDLEQSPYDAQPLSGPATSVQVDMEYIPSNHLSYNAMELVNSTRLDQSKNSQSEIRIFLTSSLGDDEAQVRHLKLIGCDNAIQVKKLDDATHLCVATGPLIISLNLVLAILDGKEIIAGERTANRIHIANLQANSVSYADREQLETQWGFNLDEAVERGKYGVRVFKNWEIGFTKAAKDEAGSKIYTNFRKIARAAGATMLQVGNVPKIDKRRPPRLIIGSCTSGEEQPVGTGYSLFNRHIITASVLRGNLDTESSEFLLQQINASTTGKQSVGKPTPASDEDSIHRTRDYDLNFGNPNETGAKGGVLVQCQGPLRNAAVPRIRLQRAMLVATVMMLSGNLYRNVNESPKKAIEIQTDGSADGIWSQRPSQSSNNGMGGIGIVGFCAGWMGNSAAITTG